MLFRSPPKLTSGDRVAVLSPSFAAPAVAPVIHEQALLRLEQLGVVPVEFPTTRLFNASAADRGRDLNAAFADPSIKAIMATIGGDDQITVIPHVDAALVAAHPKIFLGYSDNTNLHNFLWKIGVSSFYGGSTQVHIGAGPGLDDIHAVSLKAALFLGGEVELTEPGESEDFGYDWAESEALTSHGMRIPTQSWVWAGPQKVVRGRTWGGCIEVLSQIAVAGRFPALRDIEGTVLLLEASERLTPATEIAKFIRGVGERGLLNVVAGVVCARPPMSNFGCVPSVSEREDNYAAYRDIVLEALAHYAPGAPICFGVPFGHTRPQWIVPYGGFIRLDSVQQRVYADYN